MVLNRKNDKKIQRFQDVETLEQEIQKIPRSDLLLTNQQVQMLKEQKQTEDPQKLRKTLLMYFKDAPISHTTIKALEKRSLFKLTEVQRCSLIPALQQRDLLVSSKTGSGKTLAFLIPIIENLYRQKWTSLDGLGALILVPTRELAIQVYEVLMSLLKDFHEMNFGLIIGGKSLEEERKQIAQMNILIATPGRFLQHLTDSQELECSNLRMLVFDEADEILSHGFEQTISDILNYLPQQDLQTLLFSATLSTKILQLCKVQLKDPFKVLLNSDQALGNVQETATGYQMPQFLRQQYVVLKHEEKLSLLYSFLKNISSSKSIVFFSTVKQVRFVYETFRHMNLGASLYEYHGRQPQGKRTAIFLTFKEKQSGILLSTNISSRGLDIPQVKWIIQADCPEDVETYVHWVGRTAWFSSSGKSVIFLDESEIKFIEQLKCNNIEVKKIKPDESKLVSIDDKLRSICMQNENIKHLAQRAFICFIKSVFKQKDKTVFDIDKINFKQLAHSFGLAQTPLINIKQNQTNESKGGARSEQVKDDNESDQQEDDGKKLNKKQKKLQKLKEKIFNKKTIDSKIMDKSSLNLKRSLKGSQKYDQVQSVANQQKEEDDFFVTKKAQIDFEAEEMKINPLQATKTQLRKIKVGGIFKGENIFDIDEQGNLVSKQRV